jgi:integrase
VSDRLYQKKKDGTWYGWYYDADEKQIRVCLKTRDKRAALLALRRLEREAHATPGFSKDAAPRPVKDLLEHGTAGRSAGTVEMWASKAGHLLRLIGDVDINDRKLFEHATAYINTRLDEGASSSTVAKEMVTLRTALKFAHKRRIMALHPTAVLPSFTGEYTPRERYLTRDEFARLLAQLTRERRLWVEVAVYTGARFSEVERLSWDEHVHLDAGWLLLPGTKTKRARRRMPISDPLMEVLVDSPRREGLVVVPWKENVRRDLAAACSRAGIKPVTPNDLRRTFASWMKQAGVDSKAVADLLGHTSTRMVDRVYGHLDDAAYRRALATLPDRPGDKWVINEVEIGGNDGSPGNEKAAETAAFVVPRDRIELPTRGFSIPCSTN